jgi:hypothetical protein
MPKKTIDEASADMSYTTFSFREAVGSVLYLATHTRPDISFTVGMLGRAMAAPSAQDWRLPDSGQRCRRELGCDQMMPLFSSAMLLTLKGYVLFRTSKL